MRRCLLIVLWCVATGAWLAYAENLPQPESQPTASRPTATRPVKLPPTQVEDLSYLHPRTLSLLAENGFVVCPSGSQYGYPDAPSIDDFYQPATFIPESVLQERNRLGESGEKITKAQYESLQRKYRDSVLLPFVTTDVVLHAYNTLLDNGVRDLETLQVPALADWQKDFIKSLNRDGGKYAALTEPEKVHLDGLFAVANRLMGQPVPEGVALPTWVDPEVKRIEKAEEACRSEAWGREIDYSIFRPRGLYASSEELQRYFRTRVWWSAMPLRSDKDSEMRMAVEFKFLAGSCPLNEHYRLLLGQPEDPDLGDLEDELLLPDESGQRRVCPTTAQVREGLPDALKRLREKFHPQIRTAEMGKEGKEPGNVVCIYVLPPSYVSDSVVFTRVSDLALLSRLPTGLDVMACGGSKVAMSLSLARTQDELRKPLKQALTAAAIEIARTDKPSEITRQTFKGLQFLSNPTIGPSHPPFMRTEAYARKSLQTALAGWAEYRHRWVLAAKESGGVFGEVPQAPAGFVEPNVEFYQSLLELSILTHNGLVQCGVSDDRWAKLEDMILRCRKIAEKELSMEDFSKEDRQFLQDFHSGISDLCMIRSKKKENEDEEWGQANGPVVADVHRDVARRQVLCVGTSWPQAIYVIYPWKGKNWLCRGGVMTYRECYLPGEAAPTDKEWLEKLKKVSPPDWTEEFTSPHESASFREIPPAASSEPAASSAPAPKVFADWSFDAKEAVRRQGEATKNLGISKDLILDLGNKVKMKLVLIPAGKFVMGRSKEESGGEDSRHEVELSKPFYMGVYTVTQEQYETVMGKSDRESKGASYPVEQVSWDDALEFCKALSKKTGETVVLPTESYWEYACRAGSKARYCFGDDEKQLADYARVGKEAYAGAGPVGQKKPNAWGLYDMHGNVWEWCLDGYGSSDTDTPDKDPVESKEGAYKYRALRGGCWCHDASLCRSDAGAAKEPNCGYAGVGFRVVVDVKQHVEGAGSAPTSRP